MVDLRARRRGLAEYVRTSWSAPLSAPSPHAPPLPPLPPAAARCRHWANVAVTGLSCVSPHWLSLAFTGSHWLSLALAWHCARCASLLEQPLQPSRHPRELSLTSCHAALNGREARCQAAHRCGGALASAAAGVAE